MCGSELLCSLRALAALLPYVPLLAGPWAPGLSTGGRTLAVFVGCMGWKLTNRREEIKSTHRLCSWGLETCQEENGKVHSTVRWWMRLASLKSNSGTRILYPDRWDSRQSDGGRLYVIVHWGCFLTSVLESVDLEWKNCLHYKNMWIK